MTEIQSSEDKLREFITAGKQLCLVRNMGLDTDHELCWEEDAGQNPPLFTCINDELNAAANVMIDTDQLVFEDETRKYMGLEFTRLHLSK